MQLKAYVPKHEIKKEIQSAISSYYETGEGIMDIRNGMYHRDLTELLHEFAYANTRKPVTLTIMYSREQAAPIQLQCLRPHPLPKADEIRHPLRVSLISMRHLGLDHVVDTAWILNKKLSEYTTRIQQDNYCYKQTWEQLQKFAQKGVRHIHLYQTGYQIAIIGFFRALIEYLNEQQKNWNPDSSLMVTPYYYNERSLLYKRGEIWS